MSDCPEDCPVRVELAEDQRRFRAEMENRYADLHLRLEEKFESITKQLEGVTAEWRSLALNVLELLDLKKHGTNGSGKDF